MAAPYRLRFRAIALTLRADLHSQPLMVPNFVRGVENYTLIKVVCKVPPAKKRPELTIPS
jgi:hypothetical protein